MSLPDPGAAHTVEDLVGRLRLLKVWVGDPSFDVITRRVRSAWTAAGRPVAELPGRTTVLDCFRPGRRRLNHDLVLAVVEVLHPDIGYVNQWRQALRAVRTAAGSAGQVRVQAGLPPELSDFVGRTAELRRLEEHSGTAPISVIGGMAGVGKTQLAVHFGHRLARRRPFDHVLFVNLRGFHPDPAQPPADPAAVLDGFLRLLGMPGHEVPGDLDARAAAYRALLAGARTMVVLDNAADVEQVRPLLPWTPGCPALVTSRRTLSLPDSISVSLDVFTAEEASRYLREATAGTPRGDDPDATARLAARCGYLPLALGLLAGRIRAAAGWTLTDHAERLDQRHHERRLDSGVEWALELSYRALGDDHRRMLRLAALHPGHDLDAYAAAALAGLDLPTAGALLAGLHRDHLLQHDSGRFSFHDLVRAYANGRSAEDDPPPDRRAALTRLFDYVLVAASAAVDTLYPAEKDQRPRVADPGTPLPVVTSPDTATAWLDAERPNLVAVAAHGRPEHATGLSAILFRYLDSGYFTDALAIHGHARDAGDQAPALYRLGAALTQLGRLDEAADHFRQALHMYEQSGDPLGQARALGRIGLVEEVLGRYGPAADHYERTLPLFRQVGDSRGEACSWGNLGGVAERLGRYDHAAGHHEQALRLFRAAGDEIGEATALCNLGIVARKRGRLKDAEDGITEALAIYRRLGHHTGESWMLDQLGVTLTRQGRHAEAARAHRETLAIAEAAGDRATEASARNGLGEAADDPSKAIVSHTAAEAIAAGLGDRNEQARAYAGLGRAHRALGDGPAARRHLEQAMRIYRELGLPEAGEIQDELAAADQTR